MARAKIYEFSVSERRAADIGLAVSHPARVRILEALLVHGVLSYTSIRRIIPLSEGSFSHHILQLNRACLIETAPLVSGMGGYRLNESAFAEARELFGGLLAA